MDQIARQAVPRCCRRLWFKGSLRTRFIATNHDNICQAWLGVFIFLRQVFIKTIAAQFQPMGKFNDQIVGQFATQDFD